MKNNHTSFWTHFKGWNFYFYLLKLILFENVFALESCNNAGFVPAIIKVGRPHPIALKLESLRRSKAAPIMAPAQPIYEPTELVRRRAPPYRTVSRSGRWRLAIRIVYKKSLFLGIMANFWSTVQQWTILWVFSETNQAFSIFQIPISYKSYSWSFRALSESFLVLAVTRVATHVPAKRSWLWPV